LLSTAGAWDILHQSSWDPEGGSVAHVEHLGWAMFTDLLTDRDIALVQSAVLS